jgi:hypothetical protein
MLLSPAEAAQLAGFIRTVNQGYVLSYMGRDFSTITDEQIKQLTDAGLLYQSEVDAFEQAYKAGWLKAWQQSTDGYRGLNSIGAMNTQWGQATKAGMPGLTPVEEASLFRAKAKAAAHVTGLGNTYADDFSVLSIETDHEVRKQLQQTTADKVSEAVINRETSRRLASALGDAFNDWSRDLRRIAEYELQDANQHGWAGYINRVEGPEAQVAKLVNPDACKTCRSLYVEDGRPKIFSLAELEANGTNVGLKRSEWRPVVGPTHPFCYCSLVHVPDGFGFNESGQMVVEGG